MSVFTIATIAGGVRVKNFPKILSPPFVPTKSKPFNKGLKLQINALTGLYTATYSPTVDMELLAISFSATGYQELDYWELTAGVDKVIETNYTKEVAENVKMGTGMTVVPVIANTPITFDFYNNSGTSKTCWVLLKLLK